jgi:hypothetical protein
MLSQVGQNYYGNTKHVKNYFWRENKTLKWFAVLKSTAISAKGHLFQAKHMKKGYILAILYMN